MIDPLPLKMEIAAILGVILTFFKVRERKLRVPIFIQILHWFFVVTFAVIGASSFAYLIRFVFNHSGFVELFHRPGVFGLPQDVILLLVHCHIAIGTVFFVAVNCMGQLSNRGRRIFLYLVIPVSLLYPVVFFIAIAPQLGVIGSQVKPLAFSATLLLALALPAIAFYNSKAVKKSWQFE